MTDQELLREFARAVERLAFRIPAPNNWTPQFVQLAQSAIVESYLAGKRPIGFNPLTRFIEQVRSDGNASGPSPSGTL